MAGKVRFYRGAQGTSLPDTHQDGAIFIIERMGTNNLGDMYVDMDNGKRLHIVPDNSVETYRPDMSRTTSELGQVYLFVEENSVAVGDGKALIGDLPRFNAAFRDIVRNKVNAYLGTEYLALGEDLINKDLPSSTISKDSAAETLVLSREL